mmetsp:Transcript_10145/g.29152  ORF Transcript_10145/g.29152 Transcript_10145/m.29152 type:complete len:205 (+) Transcript_10145:443-1057(+)
MPWSEPGGNTMVSPAQTGKRSLLQKASPEPERIKKDLVRRCVCVWRCPVVRLENFNSECEGEGLLAKRVKDKRQQVALVGQLECVHLQQVAPPEPPGGLLLPPAAKVQESLLHQPPPRRTISPSRATGAAAIEAPHGGLLCTCQQLLGHAAPEDPPRRSCLPLLRYPPYCAARLEARGVGAEHVHRKHHFEEDQPPPTRAVCTR